MLDRRSHKCYDVPINSIGQMQLSRNQYIRIYRQRVAGWCEAMGKAVSNSFCKQCTELRFPF